MANDELNLLEKVDFDLNDKQLLDLFKKLKIQYTLIKLLKPELIDGVDILLEKIMKELKNRNLYNEN